MSINYRRNILLYGVFLAVLALLLFNGSNAAAMITAQWKVIDFTEHGTRRLVQIEENRWYFYRPEADKELSVDFEQGKMMIKSAVRQDIDQIIFQVRIGNAFRNFTAKKIGSIGDFSIMEDIFLNLGPGTHNIHISTPNKLAYFKVFREEDVWSIPTVRQTFTPERFEQRYTLKSDDSESVYFAATNNSPLQFRSTGPNKVTGFARYLISNNKTEGMFDIAVNNRVIETVTIPPRRTGTYWLEENQEQRLSIGKKIEFELPPGEHRVQIIPRSEAAFIFRLTMDIPEELPEVDDPVYELTGFEQISVIQKTLSGFKLTVGTSVRYADNVFSLSDYQQKQFDEGKMHFAETRDDFITNPSIKARYPFKFPNYTLEPYVSANYYYYLNNPDKSNYSFLTGLFNSYKKLNLNLYYGYYADNYVRDYKLKDEQGKVTAQEENFEYDKNFYRVYPYFNVSRYDTALLDFRIEEYYHNEYFTSYDGTATSYGLGWRHSFPTFYLRAFYYYRVFDGDNITATADPSYESNIYDVQFRNKKTKLFGDYDFRFYSSIRFENRFFTKDYSLEKTSTTDFQSSRNDKRYNLNLGCEFYLIDNLDVILDYVYFLRNSTSDVNPNVSRDKDYSQQSIRLGFEYTFDF